MNNLLREVSAEVHQIVTNITAAARSGEITWGQRDELIKLTLTNVNKNLELAKGLLHDWTGLYHPGGYTDLPTVR